MEATQELINEAKKNVSNIAKKTQDTINPIVCYLGDNGNFIITSIDPGHTTRKPEIWFGNKPLSQRQVMTIINHEELTLPLSNFKL